MIIWNKLQLGDPSAAVTSTRDWLFNRLQDPDGTTFATACWVLWKARNEDVFNDKISPWWYIVNQIRSLVDCINKVYDHTHLTRTVRVVSGLLLLFM